MELEKYRLPTLSSVQLCSCHVQTLVISYLVFFNEIFLHSLYYSIKFSKVYNSSRKWSIRVFTIPFLRLLLLDLIGLVLDIILNRHYVRKTKNHEECKLSHSTSFRNKLYNCFIHSFEILITVTTYSCIFIILIKFDLFKKRRWIFYVMRSFEWLYPLKQLIMTS